MTKQLWRSMDGLAWEEYCFVCGGPFTTKTSDNRRCIKNVLRSNKSWLERCVGVTLGTGNVAVPIGKYDMDGAWVTKERSSSQTWWHRLLFGEAKRIFNGYTNFKLDYENGATYGVAFHSHCGKLLRRELGHKINFAQTWPLLEKQKRGNALEDEPYGGLGRYHGKSFDMHGCIVQDKNAWMLSDPLKNARNAERILSIWRPRLNETPPTDRTELHSNVRPVVCRNCPPGKHKWFTGKEKSPRGLGYSAKYDELGRHRIGRDGRLWRVAVSNGKIRRVWRRCKNP